MRSVPLTKQEKEDAAEAKDALLEAAKKAKVNPYAT
jgi:hypothetical protein